MSTFNEFTEEFTAKFHRRMCPLMPQIQTNVITGKRRQLKKQVFNCKFVITSLYEKLRTMLLINSYNRLCRRKVIFPSSEGVAAVTDSSGSNGNNLVKLWLVSETFHDSPKCRWTRGQSFDFKSKGQRFTLPPMLADNAKKLS